MNKTFKDNDLDTEDYKIGWICALPLELEAATAVLDKIHPELPIPDKNDTNSYKFGQIGSYNFILACLPSGSTGTTSAAVVVANMHRSFPFVENCLMVGIGGGAPLLPQNDIRLGDVVVGIPKGNYGGILPYLFGKTMQEGKDSGIHTILADALSKESASGKFARPGVDPCALFTNSNEGVRTSKIRISLPVAKGATFGSFGTEAEPMCLNHTRENLLRVITDWATISDTQATKQIFWLSGGAGTGKSTIARTVAMFLKDEDLFGGSFFFRRTVQELKDSLQH
ncbi:hypothetical protein TWF102_006742 [Orbilia oligospora]|uniref:Nephrocystin 3-like N-terminal domain-containing protein n=1 Tax=Orbilia oligospora TaxID=2813651 RepID=A0A7C8J8E0_ORBOL|nr:hypothetical protein TWF102_006742 [Orbilia oligospora]KAF3117156.1 hypothetical protein TWF103_007309 [Orbilia oligospora]KAF3120630.1 hypothetical protein TWF703_002395 [Orbilia oligospora]